MTIVVSFAAGFVAALLAVWGACRAYVWCCEGEVAPLWRRRKDRMRRHRDDQRGRHLALGHRVQSWSRRRKLAAASGAVTAFALGAVVAWALLALRADIEGGGSIGTAAAVDFTAASVVGGTADCTATVTGGDLTLTVSGLSGEHCDVSTTLAKTGTEPTGPLTVVGLDFADATTEAFLNGTCTWPGTTVTEAGVTVTARFTLTGATGPFTALESAGVTVSDTPQGGPNFGNMVAGCPAA